MSPALAELLNPDNIRDVLVVSFHRMDRESYDRLLKETLTRAHTFIHRGDRVFVASLSVVDLEVYAKYIRELSSSFESLKASVNNYDASIIHHAKTHNLYADYTNFQRFTCVW